jgi:hypothetical protein
MAMAAVIMTIVTVVNEEENKLKEVKKNSIYRSSQGI